MRKKDLACPARQGARRDGKKDRQAGKSYATYVRRHQVTFPIEFFTGWKQSGGAAGNILHETHLFLQA